MPPLLPFAREHSSSSQSDSRRQSASSTSQKNAPNSRPGTPRADSGSQRIQTTMESIKRHSLAAITSIHGKDKAERVHKDKSEKGSGPNSPSQIKSTIKLEIIIESPPNTLYGTIQNSTGALLSGLLRMTVVDPEVTLESLSMELVATVVAKKPVVQACPDCITQSTPLYKWTFIKGSKRFTRDHYDFPFTFLFPGSLPATTHGKLGILDYHLNATARPDSSSMPVQSAAHYQPATLRTPVILDRAIAPVPERNSLRIFPPTSITATLNFAPVVHPIGELPVVMQVTGLIEKKTKQELQSRWCLRKVQWKLEERERMISPACSKHAHKVSSDGKSAQHEETRIIGHHEFKNGWKTDQDEGKIEVEFQCRPKGTVRPLCDVESPNGLTIAHALVVELVITEEWAPIGKPTHGTPTGAARVLRMQFPIIMTERAGMGIAWDEEQPPMYEDVPESPPLYPVNSGPDQSSWSQGGLGVSDDAHSEITDYTGPPLDGPAYSLPASARTGPSSNSSNNNNNNMSGLEDMQRLDLGESSSSYAASVAAARSAAAPPPPQADSSRRRGLDASDFDVDRLGARRGPVQDDEEQQQPSPEVEDINNQTQQGTSEDTTTSGIVSVETR